MCVGVCVHVCVSMCVLNDKEKRSSYINDKESRILCPGLGWVTVIYDAHVHINTI